MPPVQGTLQSLINYFPPTTEFTKHIGERMLLFCCFQTSQTASPRSYRPSKNCLSLNVFIAAKNPSYSRACLQLSKMIAEQRWTPARKFLASLS